MHVCSIIVAALFVSLLITASVFNFHSLTALLELVYIKSIQLAI